MSPRPRAVVCNAGSSCDATSAPNGFVSDSAPNAVPSSHMPASPGAHRRPALEPPGELLPIVIGKNDIGIRRAYGLAHKMGCGESWNTLADRWEREVAVVGVRQAKGLLGIGSAVKAAVSAADKPLLAK